MSSESIAPPGAPRNFDTPEDVAAYVPRLLAGDPQKFAGFAEFNIASHAQMLRETFDIARDEAERVIEAREASRGKSPTSDATRKKKDKQQSHPRKKSGLPPAGNSTASSSRHRDSSPGPQPFDETNPSDAVARIKQSASNHTIRLLTYVNDVLLNPEGRSSSLRAIA